MQQKPATPFAKGQLHLRMHSDILTPTFAVVCLSMAVLGGCAEDDSTHVSNLRPDATNAVPPTPADGDSPALPEFSELVVREFLHAWIAARNAHQFDAYAALYATRFDGIDRTGAVPLRYERELWLNSQEERFSQLPDVEMEENVIRLMPGGANISLIEKTKSGDQTTRLQRHLLLVAEDGNLKIASEHLVNLETPPETGIKNSQHKLLNEFFLILDNRYIVFDTTDMEKNGALYVNDTTALKPARREHFKKPLRKLLKRKFVIGYEDGSTAVMGITDTRAIAKYAVHGAVESYWKTIGFSEVEMGEQLWELASQTGSVYLIGILKETKKGALWAHVVRPRLPEVYETKKLDRTNIQNVKKRFWKRTASRQLQLQFERTERSGRWMEYESSINAKLFKSPRSSRKFAAVSLSAGKGCGDFYGFLQGFFHLQNGTLFELGYPSWFFQDSFIDNRDAILAIDIDHDGIPEFVGRNKLMYKIDDDWFVYELKIPLSDSPC